MTEISWLDCGLEEMVEKAGDGKRADAASDGGDGGEVLAFADCGGDVAFENAVFAGGAGIYKNGAWTDHRIRNQTGNAGSAYDYIKVLEFCQVVTTVEEGNIVM